MSGGGIAVRRTWTALVGLGCMLLVAGCSAAPTKAKVHHPKPVAQGKKHNTIAAWTCASPAPPSQESGTRTGNGGPIIASTGLMTLGQQSFEAAGVDQQGCITFYASQGSASWRGYRVTSNATHGDGVTVIRMFLLDATQGWLLASGFPGAGQDPTFLFRTTDGGKTWQAEPTVQGTPFPGTDEPLHMVFYSPSDGWITGLNGFYVPSRVEVYHTTNGGASWTLVTFSIPQEDENLLGQGEALPPVFQDSRQGTLRVTGSANGNATTLLVYGTSDGGETWTLEPSAATP